MCAFNPTAATGDSLCGVCLRGAPWFLRWKVGSEGRFLVIKGGGGAWYSRGRGPSISAGLVYEVGGRSWALVIEVGGLGS